jgi:hypothetical protein
LRCYSMSYNTPLFQFKGLITILGSRLVSATSTCHLRRRRNLSGEDRCNLFVCFFGIFYFEFCHTWMWYTRRVDLTSEFINKWKNFIQFTIDWNQHSKRYAKISFNACIIRFSYTENFI